MNGEHKEAAATIKYAVELGSSKIDVGSSSTTTTARLYAMIGSQFAGYVRQNATDRTYIGEGSATENADGTPAVYTVLNSLTFEAKTPGSDKNGYKFGRRLPDHFEQRLGRQQ